VRPLLILITIVLITGCGLFKRGTNPDPFPHVSFETILERAGGLHPPDHVALTRWDDQFYYFEWRKIVEPASMKTKDGNGRVSVDEFDRKNGQPLERRVGIVGKEDLNGQLYNAGVN
jgi:hypothetical protein